VNVSRSKVLKVVNPPQSPMARNARFAGGTTGAGSARCRKPSTAEPSTLIAKVAHGNPAYAQLATQPPSA
jgi:hypothetical protein